MTPHLYPLQRGAIVHRLPYSKGCGPARPGVYFLFVGDSLVYVGKSLCVSQRLARHAGKWGKLFTHYAVVTAPGWMIEGIETAYIRLSMPTRNVSMNRVERRKVELLWHGVEGSTSATI